MTRLHGKLNDVATCAGGGGAGSDAVGARIPRAGKLYGGFQVASGCCLGAKRAHRASSAICVHRVDVQFVRSESPRQEM